MSLCFPPFTNGGDDDDDDDDAGASENDFRVYYCGWSEIHVCVSALCVSVRM